MKLYNLLLKKIIHTLTTTIHTNTYHVTVTSARKESMKLSQKDSSKIMYSNLEGA